MSRPVKENEKPNPIHLDVANKKHPLGHSITIYSDNAVYDNTDSKFITPETLIRAK